MIIHPMNNAHFNPMNTQPMPTRAVATRMAEAVSMWAAAKVAEHNERRVERGTYRIQGWEVIES